MRAGVKLADIVDAIGFAQQSWRSFLNRQTGEIVTLTDDGVIPEDGGFDEESLDEEPFIPLPDTFEVDEWSLMRRFAESRSDSECDELLAAIHGRGAFRLFKATVRRIGAEAEWHRFRDNAIEEIAREWLNANRIEFEA